ncbi:MAG: ribosome maturation factor RimP [Defluviitaleaceae bacterium]|nr:ribosome maturation factor RimP [Defluviitaleaceae bacterium]
MIGLTKEIEKKVEELALPICAGLGVNLWAVEYVKEAGSWFLRVYIDRDGGVTIDDCEAVSRKLEGMLDARDFIDSAYVLEVGSPGIDRPLKRPEDYEKYYGEYVDIKLYKAINKTKSFQGKLRGLAGSVVTIETDDGQVLEFELPSIASCRLAVIF